MAHSSGITNVKADTDMASFSSHLCRKKGRINITARAHGGFSFANHDVMAETETTVRKQNASAIRELESINKIH